MNLNGVSITVIVVVLNGAKTLQRCIDSVADQAYSNKELIIIDGGSVDRTLETIELNAPLIDCWLSEPDRGIYHAMNKGVDRASGEWIIFLGADDFLMTPDVSERNVNKTSRYWTSGKARLRESCRDIGGRKNRWLLGGLQPSIGRFASSGHISSPLVFRNPWPF